MTIEQQLHKHSAIPPDLITAVLKQLGSDDEEKLSGTLHDIASHGVDGGFRGFIQYTDTVAFFKKNRSDIRELVEQLADDLGESPMDMVASFNCLAGRQAQRDGWQGQPTAEGRSALKEYYPSVARCLYGGPIREDDVVVANALTWFAAEEVARAYEDLKERKEA